ncbi:MAG: septum formation initiator family protein [Myxococcales bacterium]|jgi:cell division protein FtsB|nr:septum formation initiator family protein [Myxococcales bacterium]MBL0197329.1 septum formation initiator family protein [Myxococcales bacterium]HQY61864.1 septum formation initiator family protein [Polyangiaceae bacterium]
MSGSHVDRAIERLLPVAILGVAFVSVPLLILKPEGLPRMRSLDRELTQVEAENQELRRDVARLRIEVAELRDNPAAVERIARSKLGLLRKSEVVYQFGKGHL